MSSNNSLFKLIQESFGLNGKTIEIVSNRKTDTGTRISDINYTKDGFTILKSYMDSCGDDTLAYSIFEEVKKYEARYGDGTSLLIMLLVYLSKVNKEVELTEEEIDSDIDYIISLIDKEKITKDILDDFHTKAWIETVCKKDQISKDLFEFYKKNFAAKITSVRKIDNPTLGEITFKPRQGYYMYSYMHKKYMKENIKVLKDIQVALTKEKITSDIYNAVNDLARKEGRKIILMGSDTTEEVDELIEKSKVIDTIVIRMPKDEELSYIYDDLLYMFNGNVNKHGFIDAFLKEIKISEHGVHLFGFNRTKEELFAYCEKLDKDFLSTDDADKENHRLRMSNILSNDNFDVLINAKSERRYKMLYGMVEDVYKSRPHYHKGLIKGGMQYITKADSKRTSIMVKAVKNIRDMLIEGMKDSINKSKAFDLYENTIEIYEIVRSFLKEAIMTSKNNIEVKFKWFG